MLFYRYLVWIAAVAFAFEGAPPLRGAEQDLELASLTKPLEQIPQNFPMDVSSIVTDTKITQVGIENQPTLVPESLAAVIDANRASGAVFPKKGEYQFLLTFKEIKRIQKIVITGNLRGATVRVQLAELPIDPKKPGWLTVVQNKPLGSPAATLSFRPQAAFQALVTIQTRSMDERAKPSLQDISLYSLNDVREYRLEPNPNRSSKNESSETTPFDLGSMYSGARISHVTSTAEPELANHINDDNANTYWEFNAKEPESVAIVDLGESRRVREIGVVHSPHQGTLRFYVARQLPFDERNPNSPSMAQLTWMTFPSAMSDVPLFAQLKPSKELKPKIILLPTAFLNSLPPFAEVKTDDHEFSEVEAPVHEGRYVIARFVNNEPNSNSGFRIYDLNIFGDYPKDHFILAYHPLPNLETDPLLSAGQPPARVPQNFPAVDLSAVGTIVPTPSPAPPPASPTGP